MRKLLVLLSAIVLPGSAATKAPGAFVKLTVLAGSPVVDGVFLNGDGPYRFLLDTGAETNLLDARLARKLGIEATFQTKLITSAGTSAVRGAHVGNVSLGAAEATDQEFLLTSLDGLQALSPDIRGILGQSFLARFDYILDFRGHKLVFGQVAEAGTRVPVRYIHNRMAIPTSEGDLVLDSGTGTLLLFHASPWPAASAATIQASSGLTASVSVDRAPQLRIGERVYHPEKAVFDARDSNTGSGLLPASLFHALFVCNSEGYVVIDPEASRR